MSTEKTVDELLELIQRAVRKVKDGDMTFQQFNDAIKQTLQAERTKRDEMVEALEAIDRMCDGNNPAHEEIWHTAHHALQTLTQPNNPK